MSQYRVSSTEPLDKYEKAGNRVYIRLEEEVTTSDDVPSFNYLQAQVRISGQLRREDIIEAIIRSKYPTYGSELAAQSNGGEEFAEHQAWRETAKAEADLFIDNYFCIVQAK